MKSIMNISGHDPIAQASQSAAGPVEQLPASALGPKIGTGSQKTVFQAKHERGRCIALFNLGGLGAGDSAKAAAEREKNMLDTLAGYGLPVVRTAGLVECGGIHGLKQEMINGALDSADVIHCKKTLPASKAFNQNLFNGCDDIAKKLEQHQLNVEDLQMLIDSSGHPKISDPRSVTKGNPASGISMVKSLRGFALNNLLDSDSDSDSASD